MEVSVEESDFEEHLSSDNEFAPPATLPFAVPNNPDSPLVAVGDSSLPSGVNHLFKGRGRASRGRLVRQYGGSAATEAAVDAGLKWLARVQRADGSWRLEDHGGRTANTAGTALGLLPFLGAGQTHKSGKYEETVENALEYLVSKQKPDGSLTGTGGQMYAHGQATLALCEAYILTRDVSLKRRAQRAVDYIVQTQHKAGGWRYSPGQAGDTSVVGWQIMALRSAELGYLSVPKKTLAMAVRFLDSAQADSVGGKYGYMPRGRVGTAPMTAEALLCRQYTGWKRNHPGMYSGVNWLLSKHPPNASRPNMYYWYYATQVMHHFGDQPWRVWNRKMREILVNTQLKNGKDAGSWTPSGGHSGSGGRIYMTSLALLSLEVYYRHLPIYKTNAADGSMSPSDKPFIVFVPNDKPLKDPSKKSRPGKRRKPEFDPLSGPQF